MKNFDGHMKEPRAAHPGGSKTMGGPRRQPAYHSHSARIKRSPSVKVGGRKR